jgi:hypothetical protein
MEEGILKKTTIALAVASIAAFGSGFARAELDETSYVVPIEQVGQGPIYVEETPVVLEAPLTLPKVTVTCSAICQFMNGSTPPPSNLDFVTTIRTNGGVAGGGGNAAPPPTPPASSPPPPPKTKADCNNDCKHDREVRDLKCSSESYQLSKSLQTQALMAARAKLVAKGIKYPYVDLDMIPDIVLFEIENKKTNFKDFCENVAVQAQLLCYENCEKLATFLGLPFLIAPVGWKRRRKA